MKYIFLLFACLTCTYVHAQGPLNFNKRLIESENKWVAIKTAKDSLYGYGFVYLDVTAGLSAREGGTFKITKEGAFIPTKNPSYQTRLIRLQGNPLIVAWIPMDKVKEMQEQEMPDWLKSYKADTTSTAWLFRKGVTYNAGNDMPKAFYYLDQVKKIDPKYPGLEFEYIYAYNALKQYDKAVAMIENALITQPNNGDLYKELVFAQVNSNQMNKAEETYKKGIEHSSINVKTEMAFNILYTYFAKKNKEKFNFWANDIQTWLSATSPRAKDLTKMKEMLGQ
jgi:tetratricopeptide (TPR) repeat protein